MSSFLRPPGLAWVPRCIRRQEYVYSKGVSPSFTFTKNLGVPLISSPLLLLLKSPDNHCESRRTRKNPPDVLFRYDAGMGLDRSRRVDRRAEGEQEMPEVTVDTFPGRDGDREV